VTDTPTHRSAPEAASTRPDPGQIVIIGAGPAGLTAAYQLTKAGQTATVLEADDVVGGISRTVLRDGWRFDLGGHRFFTKVRPVDELWHEILRDDEFLVRPRKSRIYYQGKFYDYPIKPLNALRNLGFLEAVRCGLSYLAVRVRPPKDQSTLEGYVAANYGWRLYGHFFKTYNEKVWGVPASELSADWGAQRIKGMSLFQAVWEPIRARLLGRRQRRSDQVTSLIEEFNYPKYGPGMMWERCRELVEAGGTKVIMQTPVTRIRQEAGRAVSVVAESDGVTTEYPVDHVISSMPFSLLLKAMDPPAPAEVQRAADALRFRDFLTVALVVPADKVPWDDTWIYIHSDVRTMRIQNFRSWSPYMVREGYNVLGLEYTVIEGDESWTAPDAELIERGKRELEELRLVDAADVEAGYVVRTPKAYPVYDEDYKAHVDVLRAWLAEHAANVYPIGRYGMHKYNNQDHSMYTAMLTVENILDGAGHDIWAVNVEEEYHEEASASTPSSSTSSAPSSGTGRDAPVLPKR
jgi:protoporphyrinogen oxidase